MSRYSQGANFERRVAKDLAEQGWFVVRSAGSHSPVDLIGLRQGEIILIQCKTDRRISKVAKAQLSALANENQCQAKVAWRDGKNIQFMEINDDNY